MGNLFTPFLKAGNSKSRSGVGLGLSIAERIIRLHEGNIKMSNAKGCGLLVEIAFPYSKE